MLRVKYPIIVEGRYDKIKLCSIIEGDIITTDGFGVFKDKEKLALIQRLAALDKVILLTDSDRAGFRIRGYLSGAVSSEHLVHIYIPELYGKERRKEKPSAEGTLGVEGMPVKILEDAFRRAGVLCDDNDIISPPITKQQLYSLGLSGSPDSAILRRRLQQRLGLPQKLSSNALCNIVSRIATMDELENLVEELKKSL